MGYDMATETTRPETKKAAKEREKAEAIAMLRKWLKPGDTVYTVLRHVSRSGMMRKIDLYKLGDDGPTFLTGYAATAMGYRWDTRDGIIVGGCGMDMGFALVYNLSSTLFRGHFECIGEAEGNRCPSNDHSNGDRNYAPHMHSDGGYALRHRWL